MKKNVTTVEKKGEREVVVRRTFDGPARLVFEAFTKPELLRRWWSPKASGMSLVVCEVDARTGGSYRYGFGKEGAAEPAMVFFGKYLEVTPSSRLVSTSDEAVENGSVTTTTFEEVDGKTRVVVSEVFATQQACDESFEGMSEGACQQHEQLDELLVTLAGSGG